MASDLNRVILIGRLTKDPELKHTPNGTAVAQFTLANGYSYNSGGQKKEQTSFFDCVAWSKLGELTAEYCRKGHKVAIEGRLGQRTWEHEGAKRSKIEITVENIQFIQGKQEQKPEDKLGHEVDNVPSFDDANPFDDSALEKLF